MTTAARKIPLALPDIGEEEIAEVVACLRSGWITTGPRVKALEAAFAERVGARHAVSLSSCTAALHVALLALGVGAGDEVIVPPLTWPATASMVVACGATPVFADIDPETWCLDPEAVAAALTPRTRVVIPVHYAGQPADLDALAVALERAGRADVRILEDAAHAAGTRYKGREIGRGDGPAIGACFSFHPIKNMTTGEGGMLTTDDEDLAKAARLWRFHGVERDAHAAYAGEAPPPDGYDVTLPGFKYNLSDIHAAIGIHQLAKLDRMNARRRDLATLYREELADVPGITLLQPPPYDHLSSVHLFPVLAPPGEGGGDLAADERERVRLVRGLHARGVGTGRHFEPVHLHAFYRARFGATEGMCPVAERVAMRVLSLPLYPTLPEDDVRHVARALREVLTP